MCRCVCVDVLLRVCVCLCLFVTVSEGVFKRCDHEANWDVMVGNGLDCNIIRNNGGSNSGECKESGDGLTLSK